MRWNGLTMFLDDGRIDLDYNTVERSIRPLALNRKNALLAGSDEGGDDWVFVATLIECCKLNELGPSAWLTNTLARLVNGHPRKRGRRTHALDRGGLRTSLTHQRPAEKHDPCHAVAELCASLRIGGYAARVVVGCTGNETRT
jgi:hypothetical protein